MQEAQGAGTGPSESWRRERGAGPQSSVAPSIGPWNVFASGVQGYSSFPRNASIHTL